MAIFFGSSVRGEEVKYGNLVEMNKILDNVGISSGTVSMLEPIAYGDRQYPLIVSVRNTSKVPINHATVTFSSNKPLLGTIMQGMHALTHGERQYDIGELRPYSQSGEEFPITIQLSVQGSIFDPLRLLATVDGDTLKNPHSEAVNIVFTEVPH